MKISVETKGSAEMKGSTSKRVKVGSGVTTQCFLSFFLPATVFFGPLRVRALVWVR
jgi:hypothetical protein